MDGLVQVCMQLPACAHVRFADAQFQAVWLKPRPDPHAPSSVFVLLPLLQRAVRFAVQDWVHLPSALPLRQVGEVVYSPFNPGAPHS
jgi:hypothetical protein